MPTGYTNKVEQQTFEEFVWGCAEAFGALITLRDAPKGTPVPDKIEPSEYAIKALAEAEAGLEKLLALKGEDLERAYSEEWAHREKCRIESLNKMEATLDSYEAMLEDVREWQPPTQDHVALKEFMESQLKNSLVE